MGAHPGITYVICFFFLLGTLDDGVVCNWGRESLPASLICAAITIVFLRKQI